MCVCNRKGKYMKHSTSKVMELEPHLVGDVFLAVHELNPQRWRDPTLTTHFCHWGILPQ